MSNTTLIREIFVGRAPERTQFHQHLRELRGTQVLHFYGGGGTGKTSLLEWMAAEAARLDRALQDDGPAASEDPVLAETARELRQAGVTHVHATADLIDFYRTDVHTMFGLLSEIARQLGIDAFAQFVAERDEYDRFLQFEIDPVQRSEKSDRVLRAFHHDYAALAEGSRIILLIDTFESSGWVGTGLLGDLLPDLTGDTLIVVVGRQRVSFPEGLAAAAHSLEPLSSADAITLYRQRGLSPQVVSDAQIEQVTELVRGRPIYLNLAADWIANSEGVVEQLLVPNPTEELGRTLVRHVLDLQEPEDQAILYLAYIWRRGDPALVAHLMGRQPELIGPVIAKLSRFSFIKYRPGDGQSPGSCLLHDEMRDLITEHCWNDYDQTGELRRALLRSTLAYYEQHLTDLSLDADVATGKTRSKKRALRNYQIEWVYYQLRLDLQAGLSALDTLVRDASHHRDVSFFQQLLEEVERKEFWPQLDFAQQAEHYFRKGLVLFRREKYAEAEEHWRRITGSHPSSLKYKATALHTWAEMDSDRNLVDSGLQRAQQAEELYLQLLTDRPGDPALTKELGETHNNRGRLLRQRKDLTAAKESYTQALDLYATLPPAMVTRAIPRTLNNLGFVYSLEGDLSQAKSLCGMALQLRKRLDDQYELGLSYNTMGMILEDDGDLEQATDMYANALTIFDEIDSDYGRLLTLPNNGRMRRHANDFNQALAHLTRAYTIAERGPQREGVMALALNEIACVYRERGQEGDLHEAEEHFWDSIAIARRIGDKALLADNLVNLAVLFARQGRRDQMDGVLAEADPLLVAPELLYYRSMAHWARALALWRDVERTLTAHTTAPTQAAMAEYIQAAADCARNIQMGPKVYRAKARYLRILNEIQRNLHNLPPEEIRRTVPWLQSGWRAQAFGSAFGELDKICSDTLKYIQYL